MLPKALPPFQVLCLALFSLRENCLRARMKLGTRDVPEQHGPDRRWHISSIGPRCPQSVVQRDGAQVGCTGEPNILGISAWLPMWFF